MMKKAAALAAMSTLANVTGKITADDEMFTPFAGRFLVQRQAASRTNTSRNAVTRTSNGTATSRGVQRTTSRATPSSVRTNVSRASTSRVSTPRTSTRQRASSRTRQTSRTSRARSTRQPVAATRGARENTILTHHSAGESDAAHFAGSNKKDFLSKD